jgi:hypothetical protein
MYKRYSQRVILLCVVRQYLHSRFRNRHDIRRNLLPRVRQFRSRPSHSSALQPCQCEQAGTLIEGCLDAWGFFVGVVSEISDQINLRCGRSGCMSCCIIGFGWLSCRRQAFPDQCHSLRLARARCGFRGRHGRGRRGRRGEGQSGEIGRHGGLRQILRSRDGRRGAHAARKRRYLQSHGFAL